MKKRFFSFILLISCIFCASFLMPIESPTPLKMEHRVYAASDVWLNYRSNSFSGGDGSSSSPYLISSAEEMGYLNYLLNGPSNASYNNKHYKLTADINLSAHYWTPIGSNDFSCRITLNGDYHAITNLTVNQIVSKNSSNNQSQIGFIGIGMGCNIFNLVFINPSVQNSEFVNLAGIVFGDASSGCCLYNIIIINGYLNVNAYWAGSLVGWKGASEVSINECYVTANIYNSYSSGWTGGLIAESVTPITNCLFYGSINSANASGGLVGVLQAVSGMGEDISYVKIQNCNSFVNSTSGSGKINGFAHSISQNTKVYYLIGSFSVNQFSNVNGTIGYIYNNVKYIPSGFDLNLWIQQDSMFNGVPYLKIFYW